VGEGASSQRVQLAVKLIAFGGYLSENGNVIADDFIG
jgi:hypothetical protein